MAIPLLHWRKVAGLTQQQLAADCGMQASQVSMVERGLCGLSIESLRRVSETLAKHIDGRSARDVAGLLVVPPTPRPTPAGHCTPAAEEAA